MGEYGIMLVDCRGAKVFQRVPGDPRPYLTTGQWEDLGRTLQPGGHFSDVKMLIWGTQVPIIFLGKSITEKIAKKADDFEGIWAYKHNEAEQIEMLNMLYNWSEASPTRNIVLSGGDVHLGGLTEVYRYQKLWAKELTVGPISNKVISGPMMSATNLLRYLGNKMPSDWRFKHQPYHGKRNFGMVRTWATQNGRPETSMSLVEAGRGCVNEKYQYAVQGRDRQVWPKYEPARY